MSVVWLFLLVFGYFCVKTMKSIVVIFCQLSFAIQPVNTVKMPPKKSNYGRKSAKAKQMEKIRSNLSPESKEKLLKRTKESMQKYRANMDEEKLEDIQLQNMYSHQNHR